MMNGESSQWSDGAFYLKLDGQEVGSATPEPNRAVGISADPYDGVESAMANNFIQTMITVPTPGSHTLTVNKRDHNSSAYALNRTFTDLGNSRRAVSTVSIDIYDS